MDVSVQQAVQRKYAFLGDILDERGRRFWAAAEASELGRGGVSTVARATGLSRTTIDQGIDEWCGGKTLSAPPRERVRAAGGGRRSLTQKDPQILASLERLVDSTTRGDPQSPLRWTCKSTRQLANALQKQGHPIVRQTVCMPFGSGLPLHTRVVVPGLPHPVTQRGNRRQQTFFGVTFSRD